MTKQAPDRTLDAGGTRARPNQLIVRLAWFAAFWLLGVAAVGGVAAVIHWALAPR